ncbi:MAG: glutamine synthetase type III, partial [Opitutaceae bacterium]|nr:glutamine synthetase type III [Cytophagales bacterium]
MANKTLKDNIIEISKFIDSINEDVEAMIEERKVANAMEDAKARAIAYCEKVKPYFDKIRYCVDKLELMVSDEAWPLPKYREMLFIR